MSCFHCAVWQWRNQGLQRGGGDKLSAEGANTVEGSGDILPAFWGEILQNSEYYNIIIRSRMPASSVTRLRIISWT